MEAMLRQESQLRKIACIVLCSILAAFPGYGFQKPDSTEPALPYVLNKCETFDIVFLGTKHKQDAILEFISDLLPKLSGAGVSHLGLEIASDQQENIDHYMEYGTGLDKIAIHYALDHPSYRNLLTIARNANQENSLQVKALDLPPSLYESTYNRDEWMGNSICQIFDRNPEAKVLVIVGNLHVLKNIAWEDRVKHKRSPIRGCLSKSKPGLKMFSILGCVGDFPASCDFCRNFGSNEEPVAVDCKGDFSDWKPSVLDVVKAKPMKAYELVDGVIVY